MPITDSSLRRTCLQLIGLLLALAVKCAAQEPTIPAWKGFVSDYVGVLDEQTVERLELLLTDLREKTGAEIAVVVNAGVKLFKIPGLTLPAGDPQTSRRPSKDVAGTKANGVTGSPVGTPDMQAMQRGLEQLLGKFEQEHPELNDVEPVSRQARSARAVSGATAIKLLPVAFGLALLFAYVASLVQWLKFGRNHDKSDGAFGATGGFGGGFSGGFGGFGGGAFGGGGAGGGW